jgi:hypothetical protein
MKRSVLLPLGFALTALFASAVVPACSNPGEEDATADDATGEEAYTTEGTCDGLPRVKNLKTPAGVCVGVVSTGFTFARGIAQLDNGDLVVAEMGGWAKDRGGVWLLRQKADKTFAKTKLNAVIDKPSGIAVGPDGLVYVGTPDAIYRFDPYAAILKADPSKTLAKSGPLAGPDAYKQPPRDSINKLDASLTDQEGDLPHEELNVITEGAHYGWPYCIDNGTPTPEYRGRVDCTHYKSPALLLPGHVAPLGMAFYTGSMFPAAYQNQLLVTFHGYREYGHRLMLVPVDAQGVPGAGEPMDIIRGWEKSADGKDPQGAPVDVLVAKDGSLLVTEDKNGDVLRVFFDAHLGNGAPLPPLPPQRPLVSADEKARCDALKIRTDAFSRFSRVTRSATRSASSRRVPADGAPT